MPKYTYTDGKVEIDVTHPLDWDGEIISGSGVRLWRKPPTGVSVNWGGLSPSAAEWQSPEIGQHVKDVERKRDQYYKRKEKRKK